MGTARIFSAWLRRRGQPGWGWQHDVRDQLSRQRREGLSIQQIAEHLAMEMYADDMRDVGPAVDLGFFTWQLYLGAAQFVVNSLLTLYDDSDSWGGESGPGQEKDRRAA